MCESAGHHIAQLPQSELTAEQLLATLSELIINTTDAGELTKDLIEKTFNIHLEQWEANLAGYGARLTSEWNVAISVGNYESIGPSVALRFVPSEDREIPMTDICAVDANAFGARLEQANFIREARYGIHGERWGSAYRRGTLQVVASTEGEANEPAEKIAHACIESVQIRRHG